MKEVVTSSRIIKDLGVTDECVMDETNVLPGLLQRAESCPVDGKKGTGRRVLSCKPVCHSRNTWETEAGVSQVQGLVKLQSVFKLARTF